MGSISSDTGAEIQAEQDACIQRWQEYEQARGNPGTDVHENHRAMLVTLTGEYDAATAAEDKEAAFTALCKITFVMHDANGNGELDMDEFRELFKCEMWAREGVMEVPESVIQQNFR